MSRYIKYVVLSPVILVGLAIALISIYTVFNLLTQWTQWAGVLSWLVALIIFLIAYPISLPTWLFFPWFHAWVFNIEVNGIVFWLWATFYPLLFVCGAIYEIIGRRLKKETKHQPLMGKQ